MHKSDAVITIRDNCIYYVYKDLNVLYPNMTKARIWLKAGILKSMLTHLL